jgi:hypothetical protein
MEELFKTVFIRSEVDLPRSKGDYYCHTKGNKELDYIFQRYFDNNLESKEIWMKYVDWYFVPISHDPVAKETPEEILAKYVPLEIFKVDETLDDVVKAMKEHHAQFRSETNEITDDDIIQVADDEKQQDWDSLTDMETWADGFRYGAKWYKSELARRSNRKKER